MHRETRRYGDRRQPEAFRQAAEHQRPGYEPPARPRAGRLLPAPFRLPAAALLAFCVTVTALLGITFAGQRQAGWLDTAVDTPLKSALERFPALLNVLAAVATPVAVVLSEYVLKPLVGRTLGGLLSLPSGHATSSFALAGTCALLLLDPPGHRLPGAVRLVLASLALLAATAVAIGMVARGAHYFTDVVAGAAVGTGMVLACALILDRLWPDPRRPGSHRTGSPRGHWGRATPVRSAQ